MCSLILTLLVTVMLHKHLLIAGDVLDEPPCTHKLARSVPAWRKHSSQLLGKPSERLLRSPLGRSPGHVHEPRNHDEVTNQCCQLDSTLLTER